MFVGHLSSLENRLFSSFPHFLTEFFFFFFFLLNCMSCLYEWVSEVAQSCLTLCDPMGCSLPGSFIHGIFQARVLEWVAISFSRGSSQPRIFPIQVPCIGRQILPDWAGREAHLRFFFFLLNCVNCLYILEANSLSVANIFSHSGFLSCLWFPLLCKSF